MNNRIIKFRFYDIEYETYMDYTLEELIKEGEWPTVYGVKKTIVQFTGLLDKNGKEIYEGDVLKFNTKGGNEMIYEVKWKGAGFKPVRMSEHNREEIQIIGNIYSNPELIK